MRILWHNCHITTMVNGHYNLIEDAALITEDDKIVWVGASAQRPGQPCDEERDLQGKLVTPRPDRLPHP
ncbi:imidazolonepropionase [Cedecea lapagei]|uniref:Imidazolonepropionase n=1 Tax=Cedecea lapagei TaxID=158823 RepID=A0A3S4JBD2_9ENTR|nr:imidazolonepropionase [Cedecea lapagei]